MTGVPFSDGRERERKRPHIDGRPVRVGDWLRTPQGSAVEVTSVHPAENGFRYRMSAFRDDWQTWSLDGWERIEDD